MDLPELDDLTFFAGLSRSPTLTAAARDWGVSPSAVSKRLTRLEDRLGTRLIQRSTRSLHLTDEGERYAAGVAGLLSQLADLEDSVGPQDGELRGRIVVAAPIGIGRAHIGPLLAEFARAHPRVDLTLELSHRSLLVAGAAFDVGIRVGHATDSRLPTRFLHSNRRIVCASPDYLRRHGRPTHPADLAGHSCIVVENERDYHLWRFGAEDDPTVVRVTGHLTSNDGDIATEWAVGGLGLIKRSSWQVDPLLRSGALVRVLDDIPTPDANIVAVLPADTHETRRVAALLDHLQTGLRRRLAPPARG